MLRQTHGRNQQMTQGTGATRCRRAEGGTKGNAEWGKGTRGGKNLFESSRGWEGWPRQNLAQCVRRAKVFGTWRAQRTWWGEPAGELERCAGAEACGSERRKNSMQEDVAIIDWFKDKHAAVRHGRGGLIALWVGQGALGRRLGQGKRGRGGW
ncbi:hypothetical protein TRVL_04161 [Trypanosoma vivax]|nr:hypothetical protein TRVL_04161 [Trypanosoma vivax]